MIKNKIFSVLCVIFLSGCGSSSTIEENEFIVVNDNVVILDGKTISIDVLENDHSINGDEINAKVFIVSLPHDGNISVEENNMVLYTPNASFSGKDTFKYCVGNSLDSCSKEAQVVISVQQPLLKREIHTPVREAENWYMQMFVTNLDNGQKYSGLKLGEINASNATRSYSLKAFDGSGYPYINLVAIDPDGELSGNYTTFYKPYRTTEDEERWRFKVQVSEENAVVELGWQGVYILTPYTDRAGRECFQESLSLDNPLIRRMKLVDVETGDEVSAVYNGHLQRYRVLMENEREHWFEWVLSSEEVTPTPQERTQKISIQRSLKRVKTHSIDLRQPPQVKDMQ